MGIQNILFSRIVHLLGLTICSSVAGYCVLQSRSEKKMNIDIKKQIVVFSDTSDAEYRFSYAIHDDRIVIQRCIFPGFKERVFFVASLNDKMIVETKKAAQTFRRVDTVKPGTGWYTGSVIPDSKGDAFIFDKDSSDVKGFFASLKNIQKKEMKLNELPEWFRVNKDVRKRFGFQEDQE